jgi:hypothetical protein
MGHPLAVDQHVTHQRAVQDIGMGVANPRNARPYRDRDRPGTCMHVLLEIHCVPRLKKWTRNAPWGAFPTGFKSIERSGSERFNIDYRVSFSNQLGCLRDKKLPLVPALLQHFAFHAHELHLALRVERTVGLIAE